MSSTLFIYTRSYNAFRMGGDPHGFIKTKVEVGDPVELSGGIKVHEICSPDGSTYIAEAQSGAIVGHSLDAVRADLAEADPAIVAAQLAEAQESVAKAEVLSNTDFWSKMARARRRSHAG